MNSPGGQNKLFITNISNRASRYAVYELLAQTSKISGFHYNQNKGYCFAEFGSREELEYTCSILEGIKLYGKRIYFNRVEEQITLLVHGIGTEIDEAFLWDVFGKFGSCHVEICEGVGYVAYKKREHAAKAQENVDGRVIGNSAVSVELHEPGNKST